MSLTNDELENLIRASAAELEVKIAAISGGRGNSVKLQEDVSKLTKNMAALNATYSDLSQDIKTRPQLSDLSRLNKELSAIIKDNNTIIKDLEQKLAMIYLPSETRFYLEDNEVADFKSNFSRLNAMMAKFDTLYKNLVAYSAIQK